MTRRPRLALTALAAAAALGLSGCGAQETTSTGSSEAAAVVGNRTVTVGEVQSATKVVNEFIRERGGQTTVSQRDILGTLMLSPQILERAEKSNLQIPSEQTVRDVLDQINLEAPESAVEFIRVQSVREQLGQSDMSAIAEEIRGTKIKVNPRFGSYDPQQGLTASAPNWLEELPQAAPGGVPEQHSEGDGHNH